MQIIDHGPKNPSRAYTGAVSHLLPFLFHNHAVSSTTLKRIFANTQLATKQSLPSESGPYHTPASSLGPGDPSSFTAENVTNVEAPKVESALTNKQLKKKARKLKQAQNAKVGPRAKSSDKSRVLSASAEATLHSQQSSMPASNGTIVPSENETNIVTENERSSKPSASDSSSELRDQLLAQRMEFRQRIEEVDEEFETFMADLRQQGIAVDAKYAGLMSSIKRWTNEREVLTDVNAPVSCLYELLQPSVTISRKACGNIITNSQFISDVETDQRRRFSGFATQIFIY